MTTKGHKGRSTISSDNEGLQRATFMFSSTTKGYMGRSTSSKANKHFLMPKVIRVDQHFLVTIELFQQSLCFYDSLYAFLDALEYIR